MHVVRYRILPLRSPVKKIKKKTLFLFLPFGGGRGKQTFSFQRQAYQNRTHVVYRSSGISKRRTHTRYESRAILFPFPYRHNRSSIIIVITVVWRTHVRVPNAHHTSKRRRRRRGYIRLHIPPSDDRDGFFSVFLTSARDPVPALKTFKTDTRRWIFRSSHYANIVKNGRFIFKFGRTNYFLVVSCATQTER